MNHDKSARSEAVDLLVKYEQSSISMKTLLRELQTTSIDFPDSLTHIQSLVLSVLRFRNTIDFVLSRSLVKGLLRDLSPYDRNLLRAAVYEARWLQSDITRIYSLYPSLKSNFARAFNRAIAFSLDSATEEMPLINRLSLKHSHPTFLVKTLLDNLSLDESVQLMTANNRNRVYYIRPNRLYDESESVFDSLKNVKLVRDREVPDIFQIVEGVDSVVASQAFKDGHAIIQDKASIITVNTLDPKPGQKIWDACAAPGMKTQLIAEKTMKQGQIIATDVYPDRVRLGKELSINLNASHIEWIHADATEPIVHDADKILIDAPCTSTGILQSYPSFKWRLNKDTLFALMTIQNKILDAIISTYVDRPDTEIVFSTCSILPHEGESQIDSIMQRHDIELLQPIDYGDPGYSGFKCSSFVRRLFPHKHACSGFFIARFKIRQ